MSHLSNRKVIKYQRSYIEDYFKFIKEGLGFKHLHKYTYDSMHKTTSLIVLLSGIIIHYCVDTKEDFQKLSKANISRTLNLLKITNIWKENYFFNRK